MAQKGEVIGFCCAGCENDFMGLSADQLRNLSSGIFYGTPQVPADLLKHECLLLRFPGSTQFQWQIIERGKLVTVPVKGNLDTDNGDVLTDWVLEGRGLAVKSVWEIIEDLNAGRLVRVMLDYPPNSHPIWAVFPGGPYPPPRLRLWIDHLVGAFQSWDPHHPERFG